MTHPGFSVMLHQLMGNHETVDSFAKGKGQKIVALSMQDEQLKFEFDNGYKMVMYDDGQSCCESRYMTTDDDLTSFIGATLLDAELREAPNVKDECGDVHEVQFLLINTSLGTFTCETHNEHNGYYGGFAMVCKQA